MKKQPLCPYRPIWYAALFLLVSMPGSARAQENRNLLISAAPETPDLSTQTRPHCAILYLGIVGALEPPENKSSGVVQLREILERPQFSDVCAKSYSPYTWTEGRDWLLSFFPSQTDVLSPEQLAQAPKIVLVGHSMGGWAVLSVARELRKRDIPVELTVQVDSVGLTDFTIPRNVKMSAIFHAHDFLMFMTTKNVRLEDPAKTKMVANVLVAGAGHQSITRDPRIRELVLHTVEDLQHTREEQARAMVQHNSNSKTTGIDEDK
jgi:hypothetical protein